MKNEVQDSLNSNVRSVKVILIGSKQVGKSSFLKKLIKNQFTDIYDPTIYDKYTYLFNDNIEKFITNNIFDSLCINFIDTGDCKDNFKLFEKDVIDSDYFLMMYSIDKIESFSNIKETILKIQDLNVKLDEKNCILIPRK